MKRISEELIALLQSITNEELQYIPDDPTPDEKISLLILAVVESALVANEEGKLRIVVRIFLDLAKAMDMVDPNNTREILGALKMKFSGGLSSRTPLTLFQKCKLLFMRKRK